MRTTIAICTAGRGPILHETVSRLGQQTLGTARVLVGTYDQDSVLPETRALQNVEVIFSNKKGTSTQRNVCAEKVQTPFTLFLDDDVELAADYIQSMEALFDERADIVIATAELTADGSKIDSGLTHQQGAAMLSASRPSGHLKPIAAAMGCNFFVRTEVFRTVSFDERLPLYGWLEDMDFCTQAKRYGRIMLSGRTSLVHLGSPSGRTSGVKFGYSQIANPLYLWKKSGEPSLINVIVNFWLRLVISNAVRSLVRAKSERIDRPGRLRGNLLAFRDLLHARIDPERILSL